MSEIAFIASLPPIGSAVKLDGNGDGCRVQLDVSRDGVAAVLELVRCYAGATFVVAIAPDNTA